MEAPPTPPPPTVGQNGGVMQRWNERGAADATKAREVEKRREETQGTYFPVYPNLRGLKTQGGGGWRKEEPVIEIKEENLWRELA